VMAWHEGCRKDFSSCVIKLLFQAAKEVYRPT
jgi:hypothetical protein